MNAAAQDHLGPVHRAEIGRTCATRSTRATRRARGRGGRCSVNRNGALTPARARHERPEHRGPDRSHTGRPLRVHSRHLSTALRPEIPRTSTRETAQLKRSTSPPDRPVRRRHQRVVAPGAQFSRRFAARLPPGAGQESPQGDGHVVRVVESSAAAGSGGGGCLGAGIRCVWGATFLDEPVTLGAILGLITVLGSVALVTDLGRRRDAPLPPSSAPDESPAADGNSRDARA